MHPDPTTVQMIMDDVRFFGWLLGSIITLAVILLGIYLRLYVRNALHDHTDFIEQAIATTYVRRDVYDANIRELLARIEGQA